MQYKEIVAVTGLGGLFQLVSTKSDGAIVRSLADNTTRFIPSRLHHVTPLESIEIYTTGSNVRLHEVLRMMKEDDLEKPSAKKGSAEEIRSYFKDIFPEIDEERVYASDMKKMLKWYEVLQGAGLLDFSSTDEAAAEDSVPEDGYASGEDTATMPVEAEAQVAEHAKGGDTDMPLVEEGEAQPVKKARAAKAAATEEPASTEQPAKKNMEPAKGEEEEAEAPAKQNGE